MDNLIGGTSLQCWDMKCSAAASASAALGGGGPDGDVPARPSPFAQPVADTSGGPPASADPRVACPLRDALRGEGISCSSDLQGQACKHVAIVI